MTSLINLDKITASTLLIVHPIILMLDPNLKQKFSKHFLLFLMMMITSACSAHSSKNSHAQIKDLQVLEDANRTFNINDIVSEKYRAQFSPAKTDPIALGYSASAIWLKFQIDANNLSEESLFLEVEYGLDDLVFAYPDAKGHYQIKQGGWKIPFEKWDYKARRQVFKIHAPTQNNVYYLRIESETSLFIPLQLKTDKELLRKVGIEQFVFGIYYGFIIIMIVYNLGIFFSLRDIKYFYYTLYLMFLGIQDFAINHFGQQFVWQSISGETIRHIFLIFLGLSYLFLSLFTFNSLQLGFLNKTAKNIIFAILGIIALTISMASLFIPYRTIIPLVLNYANTAGIIYITFSAIASFKKEKAAKFYFLGWLVFVLGTLLDSVKCFGIFPLTRSYTYIIEVGSAMQIVLFSLGLSDQVKSLREEKILSEQNALLEKEKNQGLQKTSNLARQVAHDIRSPLAALTSVTLYLPEVDEEKRVLIRSAVQRIDDIANDLAGKKNPSQEAESLAGDQTHSTQLLSAIIDNLISEKRAQHRSRFGVTIQSNMSVEAYGLFASINITEFKRVLSNLINNAVEAMKDGGTVTVGLGLGAGNNIIIKISDTGPGIPVEILPRLMQRGATFGKATGSGLGMFHARETIEALGGTMEIESNCHAQMGAPQGAPTKTGTTIVLTLPRAPSPHWFLPEIKVMPETHIVILDDDISIHQVWKARFAAAGITQEKLTHFTATEELGKWVAGNPPLPQGARENLYLFDYELLGSNKTGLEMIRELGLGRNAILVTSHYEEKDLQKSCEELGVRLLPKNLAGFVPILVASRQSLVAGDEQNTMNTSSILIDDSPMVRQTWEMVAKLTKNKLKVFETPDAFYAEMSEISKDTSIYVDVELGNGIRGDIEAEKIYNLGFKKVFLASGHAADDFKHLSFLSGVVGKNPPFGKKG